MEAERVFELKRGLILLKGRPRRILETQNALSFQRKGGLKDRLAPYRYQVRGDVDSCSSFKSLKWHGGRTTKILYLNTTKGAGSVERLLFFREIVVLLHREIWEGRGWRGEEVCFKSSAEN